MSVPIQSVLGRLADVLAAHAPAPVSQVVTTTATVAGAGSPTAALPTATAALPTATTALAASPTVALPTATELLAGSPTAATGTISPTATVAPLPTVPPAPVATPPAPFSADYFTAAAQPGLGLFSGLFLLLSLVLLGGGAYVYFVYRNQWRRTNRLNYNQASFWSVVGMALGGVGVLFSLLRIFAVEGLNQRVWLYLIGIVMVGFAVYAAYFFLRVYPARLEAYQRTHKPTRAPRAAAPRAVNPNAPPPRPTGSPGNPRGTSPRGERRRAKKR